MELILSICLAASAGVCREEALPMAIEQAALPARCIVEAPVRIAAWAQVHPKWKIVKWRCGARHPGGRDA